MLAPRWAWDPLSGAGAARAGGRWNIPGQAALYLSDSHATAIAEYQQNLPRPGTLTAYDVSARAILDLADPSVRQAIDVDDQFLRQPWKHMRDVKRHTTIVLGLCGGRDDGRVAGSARALCTGSRNELGTVAVE